MGVLSYDWVTENHIDFEYKKYILLAYLKKVSDEFTESKLYPSLAELVTHYRNLISLRDQKESLSDSFPAELRGFDFDKFKITYEKILSDDQIMSEIESIINFSIPQFEIHLSEGKKIYDFIESHLSIHPVGIIPIHVNEGYLLMKYNQGKETVAYEYQITVFDNPDEKYRALSTEYIGVYQQSIHNTFENIKQELIRYNKKLPNPATYVIESDLKVPFEEAFLPIAKRVLVRYVSNQDGTVV